MSLSSTTRKVIHNGNASATAFAYTFPILSAAHLSVIYTSAAGVETTLSASLYTVTGIGSLTGGTVTYPLVGSPIATGTKLTIVRTVPLTQLTTLSNQGGYYPEVVEQRLDLIYMALQQFDETISRFVAGSISDPATEQTNLTLIQALQTFQTGIDKLTAAGDSLTHNGSAYVRLARGTASQFMGITGTAKAWKTLVQTKQVFTSSGTYTPSTGMIYAIMEATGGGGGGGGCANTSATVGAGGAGGGSGSYARKYATAADVGSSQSVTIGAAGAAGTAGNNAGSAGGDTSAGALCIGKGGAGGGGNAGGGGAAATGGAGGIAGTGDVTVVGQAGGDTSAFTNGFGFGGPGGSSRFGSGGKLTASASVQTGAAATGYGSGGAGGQTYNGNGNVAGGAGTAGIVVITELCIQ